MIHLTINNIPVEIEEGKTILDAAQLLNITIPTMCFLKELKPSSSCMVCMVYDLNTGKTLPSCSALALDGMNIETENNELKTLRKNAIELLLSDHLGDCEAPCQRACPTHLNIPEINRLTGNNKFKEAAAYTDKSCEGCNAPCEKVCRRKSIDSSISIMQIVKFIEKKFNILKENQNNKLEKKFNSSYGKIRENEKDEFLKDALNSKSALQQIVTEDITDEQIIYEAQRCMHCDCRKLNECKLRDLSTEFKASQRTYQNDERKKVEKIIYPQEVIYEPQKCIKCGICVQITEKTEDVAFSFIGRGFDVKIAVPFDEKIKETLTKTAHECVVSCPTGALAFR